MYASKFPGVDPNPVPKQLLSMQPFPHLPQENSEAQSRSNLGHAPSRYWTTGALKALATMWSDPCPEGDTKL